MNMNKLFSSVLSAAIFSFAFMSCEDHQPSTKGLVAFYKFYDNADDSFGEFDGVGYNVEYTRKTPNSSNKVLTLDGTDGYVNLQTPFDFEVMTLSVQFKVQEFNPTFDLIYTSDNPALNFGLLSIATRNDEGVDNLYFNVSGQNRTVPILTGTWYHAVVVKNGKQYSYYLDDVLVFEGTFENYLTSSQGSTSAIVGCVRTLQGGFLNGSIDNLIIYDRALSKKEIRKL